MDEEGRGMSPGRCRRAAIVTCRLPTSVISVHHAVEGMLRCSAINREEANFCGNCGVRLRDSLPEPNPAPETSPASQVENETAMGAVPPSTPNGETIERFERMERLLEDRRRARRIGCSLGSRPLSSASVSSAPPCWAMKSSGCWVLGPRASGILGVPSGSRPEAEVPRTGPPPREPTAACGHTRSIRGPGHTTDEDGHP